ncbi:hypothetical protein D7Z54_11200 [Salibacterium salarium]|uniref:Uncharacterized protein n=1 Tax=Salibacterium salarium TaxID=284579 RepID=A0A3R9PL37_9BACI|nr:hypothetical protein [Salibacterium salarium]RSL33189.1 hypothetical protein D7Z54_11200 [Salibacterium salarium]
MTFDSWKTNVLAACLGFIVVFILSIKVNLLDTALTRGVISAVVLFIVTFVLRSMYRKIQQVPEENSKNSNLENEDATKQVNHLDSSPDEEQNKEEWSEEQIKAASDLIKDKLNE